MIFLPEQREIHAAILAMLHEVGMLREIVVLAVLEDEDALRLQQAMSEDEIGNGGQLLQGIGRVGKDKVELLVAGLNVTEYIGAKTLNIERLSLPFQLFDALQDEAVMVAVLLYADHLGTASRQELKRDAARAGEEVKGCGTIKVDVAHQHIEDILLGEVSRWPRLERARNVEVPSLVSSRYNPHSQLHIIKSQTSSQKTLRAVANSQFSTLISQISILKSQIKPITSLSLPVPASRRECP